MSTQRKRVRYEDALRSAVASCIRACGFVVREEMPCGPGATRCDIAVFQSRHDAWHGCPFLIVECKRQGATKALGQVLAYARMFEDEFGVRPHCAIASLSRHWTDSYLQRDLSDIGVEYWSQDDDTTLETLREAIAAPAWASSL